MTTAAAFEHRPRRGLLASLRRALAMLALPASILPVLLLGPSLVRAPEKLWREGYAELQRLQQPGAVHAQRPNPRISTTHNTSHLKGGRR